jgi:hypothetical protein
MSDCPFCAERIDDGAERCPHCREPLEPRLAPAPSSNRYWLAACLVMALISCPALSVYARELLRARLVSNQRSAVRTLERIATAQATFREHDRDGDGKLDYGTLAELTSATLVDATLGAGARQGYRFEVVPSANDPERAWMATASPTAPPGSSQVNPEFGPTGEHWYAVNQDARVVESTAPIPISPSAELPAGLLPAAPEDSSSAGLVVAFLISPLVAHLLARRFRGPVASASPPAWPR